MAKVIGIGNQDFEKIRMNDSFYIDKTDFIRQWWESADDVTLITRPRRFGKTLNMSMIEKFFSVDPEVVTTTSDKYADCFGFTQEEVFLSLKEQGLSDRKQLVKDWYDGFSFGEKRISIIHGPSSIFSAKRKRTLTGRIPALTAIWSLLLASGYLRVKNFNAYISDFGQWKQEYELELTNFEVNVMFQNMVRKWFAKASSGYNNFIRGLMVELADRYVITSNRESGFGRYDIMLEPGTASGACVCDAVIIEFKIQNEDEKELSHTVQAALAQIEEKNYQANLIAKGIVQERIRKYGFAFCGKKVLIGSAPKTYETGRTFP